MYPNEGKPVGGTFQGQPTTRPLIPNAAVPSITPRLMPRTQLERNRQMAQYAMRSGSSPFVMPGRPGGQTPGNGHETPRRDITTRFGMRIRQMRVARNLTQTRMAEEFGIDRTFLSDVECGRKSVSLTTLEILARGFNVSLSDLLKDI